MGLEITNVVKDFDRRILAGVSVKVVDKTFVSLLGPSGCGKSTLLRIIAGLEHATGGSVTLNGEAFVDVNKNIFVPPEKRNIALVFQSYALWPHLTVGENVAFALKLRKLPKKEIAESVEKYLGIVQLSDFAKRMPHTLSGGQQQRVALARALAQQPRLLLLDEPLSNLDASLRDSVRQELRRLQQQLGLTAVIVTHDWEDARSLSDQVVVLREGQIEQIGSVAEISLKPASDFVRRLVKNREV